MPKQPYRMDADLTFAAEDATATVEQIIDVLDRIGVQIDSALIEPMDLADVNPESPLAERLRS
jgi:hypothetical protein